MQKNTVDTRTSDERFGAAMQDAQTAFARLQEEKDHYKTHCALKDATIKNQRSSIEAGARQRATLAEQVEKLQDENAELAKENARMSELLYGQPTSQSI